MSIACAPRTSLAVAFVLVLVSASADGYGDDGEGERALTAGRDGHSLVVKSVNEGLFMEIGGRFHLDFRAHSGDFAPPADLMIRRARVKAEGTVNRAFEFKVQAEFADDEIVAMRDVFVNVRAKDVVQVIAGQFKAPFSQEEFQSSKYMTFVERSMLNNLAPGRRPGVMVHGFTDDKVVQYGVSVQNDAGDLRLSRGGGPDLFAQARFEPWRGGRLATLSFGGAVGVGEREGERFSAPRTSSRSISFIDEVPLNGTLVRRNVEGWWYPGPLLIQSEYDDLNAERRGLAEGGGNLEDIVARGFMIQRAYVLTGESSYPDDPLGPRRPVSAGGAGAWEIAARYQIFEIAGVPRANRVEDVTVAVNWWLTRFIRYQANVSWETFRNSPASTAETFNFNVLMRLNVFF